MKTVIRPHVGLSSGLKQLFVLMRKAHAAESRLAAVREDFMRSIKEF